MKQEAIEEAKAAVRKYGSVTAAARALKIPRKTLADRAAGVITEPKRSAVLEREQMAARVNAGQRAVERQHRLTRGAGRKIAVIPDGQVKPGVPLEHWTWLGKYLAAKQPDVIVNIGDFADMPSLSSYDKGTRKHEGKRYKADIAASHRAMEMFLTPIAKVAGYNPDRKLTTGNHEFRIERATVENAELEGHMSMDDLHYAEYGWDVIPFLQPVVIEGVSFCHYFPSGQMGRPITTASALLKKLHMSAVAGHMQGRDIAYGKRADGRSMTGIIAGSFYQHDEDYLSPFTNVHWRGFYMLHEVRDGSFDEMPVSIDFLRRKFG